MGAPKQGPRGSSDVEITWELQHGDHIGAAMQRPRGSSLGETMGRAPMQRPHVCSDVETAWELRHRDHIGVSGLKKVLTEVRVHINSLLHKSGGIY